MLEHLPLTDSLFLMSANIGLPLPFGVLVGLLCLVKDGQCVIGKLSVGTFFTDISQRALPYLIKYRQQFVAWHAPIHELWTYAVGDEMNVHFAFSDSLDVGDVL